MRPNSPPDDECVVQQAALLQFSQQGSRRLVGIVALAADPGREIVVLVPVAMIELNKPHATLGQSAGQDAVRRVRARHLRFGSVTIEDVRRFAREVGQLRHVTRYNAGLATCFRNLGDQVYEICLKEQRRMLKAGTDPAPGLDPS